MSQVLSEQEVRSLIDRIGPHIDPSCDHTYGPVFPEGRTDVCAVKRLAENGTSYGFDTLYLVWKKTDGTVAYREIANSRASKDYLHIESVETVRNVVSVKYGSGGSFSGQPFDRTATFTIE